MNYHHPQTDQFRKWKLPPPESVAHGTEDDIIAKLKPLQARSWRMEGNQLIAETELGPVVNMLPTDVIMTGIGDDGLPILDKIKQ